MNQEIAQGVLHEMPDNLKVVLGSEEKLLDKWNGLTDIARNEWICWITIAKKEETREKRLQRLQEDLLQGKRRPCCWPGCPHRNENTKKWFK